MLQLLHVFEGDETFGDDGVSIGLVDGHSDVVVDADGHRPAAETSGLDLSEEDSDLVAEIGDLRIEQSRLRIYSSQG